MRVSVPVVSDFSQLETFGQIAGIGGLALGVLLLVFREVIRKNVFPSLTREQAYNILKLIIVLTFIVALVGIAAWVWSQSGRQPVTTGAHEPDPDADARFRRIYYQGFDRVPDDEINQMWLSGESGDWRGELGDSAFRLCNASQSLTASYTSTFSYFDAIGQARDLRNAKATVRVRLVEPGANHSAAGLLFRKSPTGTDYLAFVLNFGNAVSLLRRRDANLEILWTRDIPLREAGTGTVKLGLIGDGPIIYAYVDDELVEAYREPTASAGNPGVFAYSSGCFEFDDFTLFQRAAGP